MRKWAGTSVLLIKIRRNNILVIDKLSLVDKLPAIMVQIWCSMEHHLWCVYLQRLFKVRKKIFLNNIWMIDCQPLDKTMTAIPLPFRTSEVNFTPPPFRTAQISSVGGIFSGTTHLAFTLIVSRWKSKLCLGNLSVIKIYIIRGHPKRDQLRNYY